MVKCIQYQIIVTCHGCGVELWKKTSDTASGSFKQMLHIQPYSEDWIHTQIYSADKSKYISVYNGKNYCSQCAIPFLQRTYPHVPTPIVAGKE